MPPVEGAPGPTPILSPAEAFSSVAPPQLVTQPEVAETRLGVVGAILVCLKPQPPISVKGLRKCSCVCAPATAVGLGLISEWPYARVRICCLLTKEKG